MEMLIFLLLLFFFNNNQLLQAAVSHDPSKIIIYCAFAAQETLVSSLLKTIKHFCGYRVTFIYLFRNI